MGIRELMDVVTENGDDVNGDGYTFNEWYRALDMEIMAIYGIGLEDGVDMRYNDMWADSYPISEAVEAWKEANGAP